MKTRPQDGGRDLAGALPPVVAPVRLRQLTFDGRQFDRLDPLVEEVPVALVYNGVSHAVMMASPADLEDFARGFSLCEGIIDKADEIRAVEAIAHEKGIELQIELAAERFWRLKERRRTLAGRTGCGLCGIDSLEEVARDLPVLPEGSQPDGDRVALAAIERGLAALPAAQVWNAEARALHAAAFCDRDGNLRLLREDVGRHNALDKMIGALVTAGIDPASGFALITSRCSVEMAQKAIVAGIRVLVAVSAPTLMARRLAQANNLTLAALARQDSLLVVAHGERIDMESRQ
ncbi:FdhD protein [Dongia mobilis]|uniref:Sulfur carrier protein FdhD n=1 Tax=Dongia mobilis TaxID=578943 RepID=A0A4R6WYX7_9PROT|nr:formate dehydrogenase accessory sulfurtransferase FdhD [Dongia mobilis]TDQ85449.1 FdhD protein [Dongia mobilis]